MSNSTTINNCEFKSTEVLASEKQSMLLMTVYIGAGIIAGGALGFASPDIALTAPFFSNSVLWCAITNATVGAALGQLVAGLTHVIVFGSLEE